MKNPPIWIFVVPLACILVLAGVSIKLWQGGVVKQFQGEQSQLVNRASTLITRELGYIHQIVDFVRADLETVPPQAFASQSAWRNDVEKKFMRARRLSSNVSQLRWLDSTGQEAARVNVGNELLDVVAPADLQDKSNRYYFIKGQRAAYGDIVFTPIDLNVEYGLIEEPYMITIRATTKLRDIEGNIIGLLVLNFNINAAFAELRALQTEQSTLEVLDSSGNWLLSSNPEYEWLHLFGDYSLAFAQQRPRAWRAIRSQALLAKVSIDGRPAVVTPSSFEDKGDIFPKNYVISRVRPDVWANTQYSIYVTVTLVSLLVYLAVVSLCWLQWRLSQHQSSHLKQVTRDKDRVERAHASLVESNRNLVLLQQELVEQSKLSALGMLVAGVGHELNTPLGGLRMTLSSIANAQRRIEKTSEQLPDSVLRASQVIKETLVIAEQNLDRSVSVVEQFKRITDNRTQQTLKHFKVGQVLEDTLAALKPMRKRYSNVNIMHRGDPTLEFYSLAGVVSQVLQSLIMNAFDHAFPDGQQGNLTIAFSKEEHYVMTVSDDGKGIDHSILPHLWEPFVTTSRGDQHTGLGLFMVHQWVTQLLHGKIKVENNPAGGVTFSIYIPIQVV